MQPLCNHNATSMQPLRNHYATTLCNHSATTMQPVQSRPSIRNLQNSLRYWNFFKILVPTQSDSGLWNFLKLISKMNWYTIVQINFSIKIEKFTGPCVCGWRLYLPSSPPVRAPSCNARAFIPTNLVGKAFSGYSQGLVNNNKDLNQLLGRRTPWAEEVGNLRNRFQASDSGENH